MNYENIIGILLKRFPDFGKFIELKEGSFLLDLPHCIFDMFFVPFVEELCNRKCVSYLVRVGEFLEEMELTNDMQLKELLNISFLETFILGNCMEQVIYLKSFLGRCTIEDFDYWVKRYN